MYCLFPCFNGGLEKNMFLNLFQSFSFSVWWPWVKTVDPFTKMLTDICYFKWTTVFLWCFCCSQGEELKNGCDWDNCHHLFASSAALGAPRYPANDCNISGSGLLFFGFEDGWYSIRVGHRALSLVDEWVWGHLRCLGKIIGSWLLAQDTLIDLERQGLQERKAQ